MTPERHAQIKDLFIEAVALPEHERAAFVAEACRGDEELQHEVEILLNFHSEQTISPPVADAKRVLMGGGSVPPDATESSMPGATAHAATVSTDTSVARGQVLSGRFRIVGPVGAGGMGVVFQAEDLVLGRSVALKFLRPQAGSPAQWVRRFRREVRTALSITHPHVCRVFDIEETGGLCFISMEYVAGENLAACLQREGRFSQERFVDVARQICLGVAAAHEVGVVHRDLKPANIMLDEKGNVRIMDFGLSAVPAEIPAAERIAGTPAYMAPEQFSGRGVSVRSDIYALGLILYEMACGRPAFEAESAAEFAKLQSTTYPPPPSTVGGDVEPRIEQTIMQCLEKSPAARPESVLDIAAALPGGDALALALAAQATPQPEAVSSAKPRTLRKGQVRFVLAATVVCLGILAGLRSVAPYAWENAARRPNRDLALVAEQVLAEAGFLPLAEDRVYGFADVREVSDALGSQRPLFPPVDVLTATPVFWYRIGKQPLFPREGTSFFFSGGRVRAADPSLWLPGTAMAVLELTGRLLLLHGVADGWESGSGDTSAEFASWHPLLVAAGVQDAQVFEPEGVVGLDTGFPEIRWRGHDAQAGGKSILAAGASRAGLPVFFSTGLQDAVRPEKRYVNWEYGRTVSNAFIAALFALLILAALPWAWVNHRRRRTDLVGARRLAVAVFVIQIGAWLVRTRFNPVVADVTYNVFVSLVSALGISALAGVLYQALEPFARRHWPHPLITWTRLISGRFRDPHVGQHVLIGVGLGVLLAALAAGERVVVRLAGWEESSPYVRRTLTDSLMGGGTMMAGFVQLLPDAALRAMLWVLLLAALRAGLRRPMFAAAAATLLVSILLIPRGASVQTSWLLAVVSAFSCVTLADRFGVLSLTATLLAVDILMQSPLVGTWGGGCAGILPAGGVFLLILAFAAFLTSRRAFKTIGRTGKL